MRCSLCDIVVRHMRYRGRVSEYICKQCLYFTDLNIRYLIPSEELTEYNRPETRYSLRQKAKNPDP